MLIKLFNSIQFKVIPRNFCSRHAAVIFRPPVHVPVSDQNPIFLTHALLRVLSFQAKMAKEIYIPTSRRIIPILDQSGQKGTSASETGRKGYGCKVVEAVWAEGVRTES